MWLRQEVQNGRIKVDWMGTDRMLADGFTKALSHSKHEIFIEMTGLSDIKFKLRPDAQLSIDQEELSA